MIEHRSSGKLIHGSVVEDEKLDKAPDFTDGGKVKQVSSPNPHLNANQVQIAARLR